MSHIVFTQPDGAWCVYSTVVENFVIEDATREEVREYLLDQQRDRIDDQLNEVEADERVRRLSYEDAVERAGRVA